TLIAKGGSAPYQWYFKNKAIEGATSKSLTIHNATKHHNGNYKVKADNQPISEIFHVTVE
ncbi:MAG TPA: immunoglobulin domain-containing protein, partial [Candidatus Babeliaceae bacterium]|nr:immunoglobulin domain-containing protein [Candidatus Babeliaceae bacterium]